MAEITSATLMTVDEAVKEKDRAIREGRFKDAMLIGDYIALLATAETYQTNERVILSNPRSLSRSDSYQKVWQLIEDLSYLAVPQDIRDKIKSLEEGIQKNG